MELISSQKERAAICQPERAPSLIPAPVKLPFSVPEKGAFQQRVRNGSTALGKQALIGALTEFMNGFGDQPPCRCRFPAEADRRASYRRFLGNFA